MANSDETSRKDNSIEFTLKVKAKRRKDSIKFVLDLNPDLKLLSIEETFSTYEELSKIFNDITQALKEINERTSLYNKTLLIDEENKKRYFNEGYDQNFKPEFGKIDKIIYKHNSPGESSVSYARNYNGDKKPL